MKDFFKYVGTILGKEIGKHLRLTLLYRYLAILSRYLNLLNPSILFSIYKH